MNKTKSIFTKIAVTGFAVFLLSACAVQPVQTLDQRLSAAKTPAERREVLRVACLNEAEFSKRQRHAQSARSYQPITDDARTARLKSICRALNEHAKGHK